MQEDIMRCFWLPVFIIAVLHGVSAGEISSGESTTEDSEFILDRSSDPRDHTATGDVLEINEKTKPGSDDERMNRLFDPEMHLADQLFEGCLMLDKRDKEILSHPSDTRKEDKKTHISYTDKMWPRGDIPYEITFTGIKAGNKERFEKVVELAIKTIQSKTCIRFRRKFQSDHNWIEFFDGSGCFSELGRKYWDKLPTWISLGEKCWKVDIALHMLLHALGFLHEQNRQDRNEYVRVNWNNVRDGTSNVFHRHTLYNTDMYHFQYDFNSIMHFPRTAYGKGSRITLQARHNPNKVLGGTDLSQLDIEKLNRMFCNDKPTTEEPVVMPGASKWTEWSACSRTCGIGQRFRKEVCNGEDCKQRNLQMKICRTEKCIKSPYDANFDKNSGIWEVKPQKPTSCEWARIEANDALQDHTTGIGSFLTVDTKGKTCMKGQAAYLVSSFIKKNDFKKCLNFFYLMSGRDVGSLQLRIVYESGRHMMLWERTTDMGEDWKQGAATLPITDERYKLKFAYRFGGSKISKMLVDDVYLDDGECIEGIQRCTNLHLQCGNWADKGECFKNPAYMLRKCCQACSEERCVDKIGQCAALVSDDLGVCSADRWVICCRTCQDCLDKHPRCKMWARGGECSNNPSWMQENCKGSCGVCE